MKTTEIFRVVKLCLCNILSDATGGGTPATVGVNTDSLKQSDLNVRTVCSLWAGMGHIYKVSVKQTSHTPSAIIIVKHIMLPNKQKQSLSDSRKAFSYQVEANFYEKLAPVLIQQHNLNIPKPYYVERMKNSGEIIIGMSHIESRGSYMSKNSVKLVLTWLATLHASHWGNDKAHAIVNEAGLQPVGSYWYLDTRPDEHASMPDSGWEGRLKLAARAIDRRLHERDPLQCIIHGDAKDANVLLESNDTVAMCDFQYCGKSPPTVDLAYFFCSSVGSDNEEEALAFYLQKLKERLPPDAIEPSMEDLKNSLDLAYCDFYRFMVGWGMWGSGGEERVLAVLDRLDGGVKLKSEETYDEAVRREFG